MEKRYLLAIDAGSSGVLTAALFDRRDNRIAGFGYGRYAERSGLPAGHAEHDPRDWIAALIAAVAEVRKVTAVDPRRIAGIGICAHMHAATFLDKDCRPLMEAETLLQGSINWNDSRGQAEAEYLRAHWREPIAARLTASRVLWLQRQSAQLWERVRYVAIPSAYLGHWLTGSFVVGPGDASGMLGQLSPEGQLAECKLADIGCRPPRILPRVVGAGEVAGRLTQAAGEQLGLPAGIPVAAPEGDQPIGMIASGCLQPGQASISLGSSAVLNAVAAGPRLDRPGVIDSFRTSDGGHFLMTCATSGTEGFDKLVALYREAAQVPVEEARSALTTLAAQAPAGCGGIVSLPFFRGEGALEQPCASAAVLGMRHGKNNLTFGTLTRSLLEGSTLVLLSGFEAMASDGLQQLVVSGGGSQNALWLQIIASAFDAPVRRPLHADEAGSLGAAYLAEVMVRRLEGRSDATLQEVARELVEWSDPVLPRHDETSEYRRMLPAFQAAATALQPLQQQPFFKIAGIVEHSREAGSPTAE